MAGLAILISIASFILSKKEVSNVQTTAPHPKPITLPAPSTSPPQRKQLHQSVLIPILLYVSF
ncbi:hypothetical protein COM23_28420 [Bacillus wiedmannii]|nr:hypothetical protein COM23_28420 [Bacillus wiedmannii]PHB51660.1 hypothetical protein COE92_21525 [Bacillus wiedmannii]